MTINYNLAVSELSIDVINSIKAAFPGKNIEITVSESMDETEYLLATQANRESLERSMEDLKKGNVTTFTIDELKEKFG
jgi:hypothetical protein